MSVCVCQGSLSLCRCGRWIGGGCGQEDGQPHFCAASGRPLTLKVQIKKKKKDDEDTTTVGIATTYARLYLSPQPKTSTVFFYVHGNLRESYESGPLRLGQIVKEVYALLISAAMEITVLWVDAGVGLPLRYVPSGHPV